MLVLSRKSGQELIVGDNIRITINKISGNRVTLGIEAPDEVRIIRGEFCLPTKLQHSPTFDASQNRKSTRRHLALARAEGAATMSTYVNRSKKQYLGRYRKNLIDAHFQMIKVYA